MKMLKGQPIQSIQQKRFAALGGYVFSAMGINASDVGSMEKMVALVNDVFEAGIVYQPVYGAMIDQMWGFVSGLTKSQRKKLKNKNLHKVQYPMKGVWGAKQRAKASHASYHSQKSVGARKAKDTAFLDAQKAKHGSKPVKAPSVASKGEFYKSWEWRTLRMEAIKQHGRSCQCCGATPGMFDAAGQPVRICVDHIKPISKHWNLRLQLTNLQILCDECNQGKGNWDETDYRPSAPDEWVTSDCEIDPALIHQLTDRTTGRLQ